MTSRCVENQSPHPPSPPINEVASNNSIHTSSSSFINPSCTETPSNRAKQLITIIDFVGAFRHLFLRLPLCHIPPSTRAAITRSEMIGTGLGGILTAGCGSRTNTRISCKGLLSSACHIYDDDDLLVVSHRLVPWTANVPLSERFEP